MNILFLTMSNIKSIDDSGLYEDLLREFVKNGHHVFIATPSEKRLGESTKLIEETGSKILRIKTGNLQKTSFIKKGIATLRVTSQFKSAIKKYFGKDKFDLILYSTPPITLDKVVEYVKKRDNAKTFLLLKDIFPQNALDIGVLKTSGIKGIIYRFFRKKEKRLYALSDHIGCMSQANIDFVLKNNRTIKEDKLCIVPNCIEPKDFTLSANERTQMREKYGIPQDKTVFVYGGNLGKPQDIPYIIKCLKSQTNNEKVFFLIVGDGTDCHLLEEFVEQDKPVNVKVMKRLPKVDFDKMVASCDVGMIFLDHRFTIPNYPSRLLSYMQVGIPVLACTDTNTDVGKDIVEGGFGWWCESNSVEKFSDLIKQIVINHEALTQLGVKSKNCLVSDFTVKESYNAITKRINDEF